MTQFGQHILDPLRLTFESCADRNAFYINNQPHTYRTLRERIRAIRAELRRRGIHHTLVAVALDDHIDTYASILALWMEGNAYLPLNPHWPLQRNLDIISQTSVDHLLYTPSGAELSQQFNTPATNAILTTQLPQAPTPDTPPLDTPDTDLAYILFTSGSTGKPKGVCLTRDNLAAFIDSFWHTGITIDSSDRCLQAFDLTFDVSIQSFLTALIKGACVYTIPFGQVKYLYAAALITEQGITCAAMAPSMLSYLRPYFDELDASSLRTTILTAEACPSHLAEEWYGCAKNTAIFDLYGPTEATIYSTCYPVPRSGSIPSSNGVLPIGEPLKNVRALIIDSHSTPLPPDNEGELCLAGRQVTPGYWQNPTQDAKAFITLNGSDRYYRTGDLCTQLPDGTIIYHGRIDQQAKIQGYRVELGEIEHHAASFLQHTCRTVAVTYQTPKGLDQIALFVENTHNNNDDALIQYLNTKLPQYMIPAKIIHLQSLPLNANQKIDRNALKAIINNQ